jgi:hypothetical protein
MADRTLCIERNNARNGNKKKKLLFSLAAL